MWTKEEQRLYDQERYKKNREAILLQKKEYYKTNIEKINKAKAEYRRSNAEKILEQNREYNRTVRKKRRIHEKYGLTIEDYSKMVSAQGGACAICGSVEKLAVDHDHKTGAVRGLLCYRCNTGIGFLKDSTSVLASAIRYLEKSNQ
jgi:hypothetical protein